MSFQLIIRNNLLHDADSFDASLVGVFTEGVAQVGTSEVCDCQVLDSQGQGGDEIWFVIEEEDGEFMLCRRTEIDIYLNNRLMIEETVSLTSGDDVRVEHWTFRFQKIHQRVPVASRADWPARLSKAVIVLLIVIQLMVALWLPGHLDYESLVKHAIVEQETVLLLDQNRRKASGLTVPSHELTVESAALRILTGELDQIAFYIRRYRDLIPYWEWVFLQQDLEIYRELLDSLEEGRIPVQLPDLAIDRAVRGVIESSRIEEPGK